MKKGECAVCGKQVNVEQLDDLGWCNECAGAQLAIDNTLGALVKGYASPLEFERSFRDHGDPFGKALGWFASLGLLIVLSGLASVVVTIVLRRWITSIIILSITVVLLVGLWLLWRYLQPDLKRMSEAHKRIMTPSQIARWYQRGFLPRRFR